MKDNIKKKGDNHYESDIEGKTGYVGYYRDSEFPNIVFFPNKIALTSLYGIYRGYHYNPSMSTLGDNELVKKGITYGMARLKDNELIASRTENGYSGLTIYDYDGRNLTEKSTFDTPAIFGELVHLNEKVIIGYARDRAGEAGSYQVGSLKSTYLFINGD